MKMLSNLSATHLEFQSGILILEAQNTFEETERPRLRRSPDELLAI